MPQMKFFFSIICGMLLIHGHALAGQVTLSTQHASPHGNYDTLRLSPKISLPASACQPGSMLTLLYPVTINNQSGNVNHLLYCYDNYANGTPNPRYVPLGPSPFTYHTTNPNIVHSSDSTNANLQVGIGPATNPILRLGIGTDGPDPDGSFIALGTFGKGFCLPDHANNTQATPKTCTNNPPTSCPNCPGVGTGTRFVWLPAHSALRIGTIDGTGAPAAVVGTSAWNPYWIGDYSNVLGGKNHLAFSNFSSVVNGEGNLATGEYNFIGNGKFNTTGINPAFDPTDPTTLSSYAVVVGGEQNNANGNYANIVGGKSNNNWGDFSLIGAGEGNTISGINASAESHTVIGGGQNNFAALQYSAILGGFGNQARGKATVIAGGQNNYIDTGNANAVEPSAILGGNANRIVRKWSSIVGGDSNFIIGDWSFIGGGQNNAIDNTVTLGSQTHYSSITGGLNNQIVFSNQSFIGGGAHNVVVGTGSTIIGGINNSLGYLLAPRGPAVPADYSVALGGQNNSSFSSYTLVAGRGAQLGDQSEGTFVWENSSLETPARYSNRSNMFLIFPSLTGNINGRVGIGTDNPQGKLHVNGTIFAKLTDITPGTANVHYTGTSISVGEIGYDVAELFETAEEVEPGDVLVIDDSTDMRLRKSAMPYDSKVVGVVSAAPAILFEGSQLQIAPAPGGFVKGTKPPVVLAGRIPCKVSLENGPIKRGDLLTTSSVPGHAMKANKKKAVGAILGKALTEFHGTSLADGRREDTGIIIIFLTLQ